MEQLNISQLRNLWLRSPDERLASWREFRIELQSLNGCAFDDNNLLASLKAISIWWAQAPEVTVAIDPYNSNSWPTIWEIIHQGECCKYSRGLAMAYNMHYLDTGAHITVDRVYDEKFGDEYLLANYNNQYALNTPYEHVLNLQNVDALKVKESWDIKTCLQQKQ